ncbi:hypothetical protein HWV62_15577 [Athelia sp. TMB]|nr:hypothetical protein HWV62_15577 [Athelia sp. TMB]
MLWTAAALTATTWGGSSYITVRCSISLDVDSTEINPGAASHRRLLCFPLHKRLYHNSDFGLSNAEKEEWLQQLLILPESLYYVAVYMAVTKVYGISLLAILTWRGPQDGRDSRGPDPCASVSGTELDTAHAGVFTHTNIILSSASLENTEPRSSGTVYYE